MLVRDRASDSVPIHLIFEDQFDAWRQTQPPATQAWTNNCLFKAERHKLVLVPNADGSMQSVAFGLGKRSPANELNLWHGAALPDRLPAGKFHIDGAAHAFDTDAYAQFALGWLYARYRFDRYKKSAAEKPQSLHVPVAIDIAEVIRINSACTLARDLINTPASDMTPDALANATVAIATRFNATVRHIVGDDLLKQNFPAIHAVGRASSVPPQLIDFEWGDTAHPKVTLVGKGVCFDTGGLDLKPGASMLLMKKDMGGAACALGLAQLIMESALPIRLRVIIPAVENSVSGNAFRPSDVLATRAGLSVEVGNTDAEGRLVLCDSLALADQAAPELLFDFATLTGAARVALGPEVPALFSDDEALANELVRHATTSFDPLWRLPLWMGYDDEISSKVADMNNVSSSGFAGAIIGGLFLKRFVHRTKSWAHIDLYAWNSKERAGRPVGAEPQAIRAVFSYLRSRFTPIH